jgi:hypothetical protein
MLTSAVTDGCVLLKRRMMMMMMMMMMSPACAPHGPR